MSKNIYQQGEGCRVKQSAISLTDTAAKELGLLKHKKINLSDEDATEITHWENAVVGKFYRPVNNNKAR